MGVLVAEGSLDTLRTEALRFYVDTEVDGDIHRQAGRPERPNREIIHADPFDNARFIAKQTETGDRLDPQLLWHIDWHRATRMAESMGSFRHKSVIQVDADGYLESLGEQERRTRVRAVMAAYAMQDTDPGFGFYVWRTLFENRHKQKEQDMMNHRPVGTALMLISPPEPSRYGKRLGMFPEREMAVMQISWKHAEDAMTLCSVSLDRANLGVVRQLLAEQGVEVAGDAKPEDFIAYVKQLHFESQDALDAFVDKFIVRHDQLVARAHPELVRLSGLPKQGVFGHDARSSHSSANVIMEAPHGQLALRQEHKLDVLLAGHVLEPWPLARATRVLAQHCLQASRSDGRNLLGDAEQAAIRQLLAADTVSLETPDHAKALELLVVVHNSAIEESLRDFLAGNERAMDWMLGDDISLADIKNIVAAGTVAIENGRGADGCGGLGSEVNSDNLPDPRLQPNLYMILKYGRHNLHWGDCDGCGKHRLVANCKPAMCGECDRFGPRRR